MSPPTSLVDPRPLPEVTLNKNMAVDSLTVDEAVESMGFGKFQFKIIMICGMFTVGDIYLNIVWFFL